MNNLFRSVTNQLSRKCSVVLEKIGQKFIVGSEQSSNQPQESIIQSALKSRSPSQSTSLHAEASTQFIENVFQLKRRWILYVQQTHQTPVAQPPFSINEIGGDGDMVFFLVEGSADDHRFSTREYIKTPLTQNELGLTNKVFQAYHKMLMCANQDHNYLEYITCKIKVVKALLEYESELLQ